ncbi:MAG: class I SAM-dependent methyltransferase, partial [Acidobacteria bacterium]|nr:class I SAM-dependent methyltransferase [Acidobacteriota bacterium]
MTSSPHLWERYARAEPFWAVLTEPRFSRDALTPDALEAFYASGREHVDGVIEVARRWVAPGLTVRRALDFGCGAGRLSVPLAERGIEVTGIDVAPSMLEESARQSARRGLAERCTYLCLDEVEWQAHAGRYDLVHSYIVFQHVPPDEGYPLIARLLGCVAPGGAVALHLLYASTYQSLPGAPVEILARPCADLPPMLMTTAPPMTAPTSWSGPRSSVCCPHGPVSR